MNKKSNKRFIYDEATRRLYAPDGTFLKEICCPKSVHWNQLVVSTDDDRWRGCTYCHEKIVNLDVASPDEVSDLCGNIMTANVCVHASTASERVIFLKDDSAPPPVGKLGYDEEGRLIIHTARNIHDINRAVGMGYWPDVRKVEYDTENLRAWISMYQHPKSGRLEQTGDLRYPSYLAVRSLFGEESGLEDAEVVPFFKYYPYFQQIPIAAYLIPRDIADGTEVCVLDPIEDFVGGEHSQGAQWRAGRIRGQIVGRKVCLDKTSVEVIHILG